MNIRTMLCELWIYILILGAASSVIFVFIDIRKKDFSYGKISIACIVVIIFSGFIYNDSTEVPYVCGVTLANARQTLNERHLYLEVQSGDYSNPNAIVVSQNIGSDIYLEKWSTITVNIDPTVISEAVAPPAPQIAYPLQSNDVVAQDQNQDTRLDPISSSSPTIYPSYPSQTASSTIPPTPYLTPSNPAPTVSESSDVPISTPDSVPTSTPDNSVGYKETGVRNVQELNGFIVKSSDPEIDGSWYQFMSNGVLDWYGVAPEGEPLHSVTLHVMSDEYNGGYLNVRLPHCTIGSFVGEIVMQEITFYISTGYFWFDVVENGFGQVAEFEIMIDHSGDYNCTPNRTD
jgi:hypothetical protein